MHFKETIEIDRSIEEVVKLFDDPDNMPKWLQGLKSSTPMSGERGEEGSTSKVVFQPGGTKMEMTETILKKDLPNEYTISYDGKGYSSVCTNRFADLGNGRTRFETSQDVSLRGALRFAGALLRGTIAKQVKNSAKAFKQFAESQA